MKNQFEVICQIYRSQFAIMFMTIVLLMVKKLEDNKLCGIELYKKSFVLLYDI